MYCIINHRNQSNQKDKIMASNSTPPSIPANEDNMENTTPTPTAPTKDIMPAHMIKYIFEAFLTDGGSPKVTEFKRHLDELVKSEIKPLCYRTAQSATELNWRTELKARFSGRGAKWVRLDNSHIEPTLQSFEEDEDIDCSAYRAFTQAAGYSWIRFAGPRIDLNQKAAAFEVRVSGSTNDHPNQLFYVAVDQLDDIIQPLAGTPHSLKLEVIADVEAAAEVEEPPAVAEAVTQIVKEEVPVEAAAEPTAADLAEIEPELDEDHGDIFESFNEIYEDEDGFTEIV
ncbi:MAG: hypothetical protein CMB80_10730 [Flammeovirgaceae bacterium]|nr:hypothetical protein [Flammeovirgaceae bacterium]